MVLTLIVILEKVEPLSTTEKYYLSRRKVKVTK